MLAVLENQPSLQSFEVTSPSFWKRQVADLLIILYKLRKYYNSSLRNEFFEPQCKLFSIFKQIKLLLVLNFDYSLIKNGQVTSSNIVKRLIVPLKEALEKWKNSDICRSCRKAYKRWGIKYIIMHYNQMIQCQADEQYGARVLIYTIDTLKERLYLIEDTSKCRDIKGKRKK